MSADTEAESRFGAPDFRQANDRTIKYAAFVEGWDTALSSIDRAALSRVIDAHYDDYRAQYTEEGECVGSNLANAVIAFLRGEGDNDG